ncbi:MAG: LamG-like jellyroll fold domain-containing protein [Sedimentisphaerales bacterium]
MRMFVVVTVMLAAAMCVTASATTLLQYNMNEESGSAILDSSGGGRDATMTAGLTRISDPGYGSAVNNVMAVADRAIRWSDASKPIEFQNLNTFTVEARINPTNFDQEGLLFSFGSGEGSAVGVVWDYDKAWGNALGRLYVVTFTSGWQYKAIDFNLSNTFVTNQWQDFKLLYKKTSEFTSTYEIYKNGNLLGSANNSYKIGNPADQLSLIEISGGVWYRQYEGAIDEFKVTEVPEPATMVILGLGGLFLARRTKK